MIEITVTVESHAFDALGYGALGSELADQSGYFTLVLACGCFCHLLVQRRCGSEGYACQVINELHVDLLVATEYSHTRLRCRTADDLADTHLDALSSFDFIQ